MKRVPKVGDRVFVDHGGDSWEARVSSPPEYGWVGVRGSCRRTGVVSVPVKALRQYHETEAYQVSSALAEELERRQARRMDDIAKGRDGSIFKAADILRVGSFGGGRK